MNVYGVCDIGKVRESNQDNLLMTHNKVNDTLVVVCDGIGGSLAGDVASQTVCDFFNHVFNEHQGFQSKVEMHEWLKENIEKANRIVHEKSCTSHLYQGMGTTMVALLQSKFGVFIVNVGDSRAYQIRQQQLLQVTRDHNVYNDMLQLGINEVEAKCNARAAYLTSAMGIVDHVRYDIFDVEVDAKYMLCSDGLHGYADYDLMNKYAINEDLSLEERTKILLQLALESGGLDNITIALVDCEVEHHEQ